MERKGLLWGDSVASSAALVCLAFDCLHDSAFDIAGPA